MRVLHLIDAASSQACPTTMAMMADAFGRLGAMDQAAMLLGGDALQQAALDAGLTDTMHAGVPAGRALAGWWRAPRVLKRAGWHDADLIHTWSVGAFTLASLRFRHAPRLLTLTTLPTARQVRWLRNLTRDTSAPAAILPISNTIRRSLLQGGVPEQAVHVLRPAIDMGRIERTRASLRRGWGIPPDEDESTRVIALLSDPPTASSLEYALNMVHTYTLTPHARPIRLITHPDQRHIDRCHQHLRTFQNEHLLIADARTATPWNMLAGCDLALAVGHDGPVELGVPAGTVKRTELPRAVDPNTGAVGAGITAESGGGGLSLLWAMAANVPIVGEATYGISEIVEDRHTALLAKPGDIRALSHRITQVFQDQHLAWSLRDMAHHEAYSFFSRRRYCDSISGVYQQMVRGETIEIPDMEVTGGLRFSGRA